MGKQFITLNGIVKRDNWPFSDLSGGKQLFYFSLKINTFASLMQAIPFGSSPDFKEDYLVRNAIIGLLKGIC